MSERHSQGVLQCPECGNRVTPDEDGWAKCYGNPKDGIHGERVLQRPCGVVSCDNVITTAEMCQSCADETKGDAFTTNWGSGA